jgi:hypothetical protein
MTDAIEDLVTVLHLLTTWNHRLANLLADHLSRGISSKMQVDELLMSTTKLVEDSLREAIEERSGGNVAVTGPQALIPLAVTHGLLKSTEPLTELLRWYFGEPRSTSHHLFVEHPVVVVLTWLGNADTLLAELDQRRATRIVPFDLSVQPQSGSALEVQAFLPMSAAAALAQNPKVEGVIYYPEKGRNRVSKAFPMEPAGSGHWTGEYDTRDLPVGTASLSIHGIDASGPYVASSGTVVTVTYGLCPHCGYYGRTLTSPCPSCGRL